MTWKLLFLLIATAAALGDEDTQECSTMIKIQCEKDGHKKVDPASKAELLEYCKNAMEYLDCASKILETCEDKKIERLVSDTKSGLSRVCDQDYLWFYALGENLGCISTANFAVEECPDIEYDSLQTIPPLFAYTEVANKVKANLTSPKCETILKSIACPFSKIGLQCGDVARQTYVDLVLSMDKPFENCTQEEKKKLSPMVREEEKKVKDLLEEMEKAIKKQKEDGLISSLVEA